MTTATRAVRFRGRTLPIVLPNRRDARLHTAAVIISIHVIGITSLGFRVSVPQIVMAILTAGIVDVAMTYRATDKLIWPASGMLTGSGVALILRLVGMESGNYWSWAGWYWFALVAGVSILTKYVIRFRGDHVFNPSNLGLVVAFLVLGSGVVEPLDFWWAPLGPWMVLAYALIVGGGVIITRRLDLLETALTFWLMLAVGLGVLSVSGHCMIAAWSPTPVCDARFWATLVTSPEIMVFLFFMITDPKTIPAGRRARIAFAASLGVFTALMIAPHTVEFGAKVGLLASLVVWTPLRWLFARLLPDDIADRSGLLGMLTGTEPARLGVFLRGVAMGSVLVLVMGLVVIAGAPARDLAAAAPAPEVDPVVEIDPATLPDVVVDESVHRLDIEVDGEMADELALTLAENLAIEGQAMRLADGSLLALSDGGSRLAELQARLDTAIATGERWVDEYRFDSLTLRLHEVPAGQSSAGLVFEASGSIESVLFDPSGTVQSRSSQPFRLDFVLRQLAGDRWVIVEVNQA